MSAAADSLTSWFRVLPRAQHFLSAPDPRAGTPSHDVVRACAAAHLERLFVVAVLALVVMLGF